MAAPAAEPGALKEGESVIFEPAAGDKFQFELWGHNASAGGSHSGTKFRLTSERIMWINNVTGNVTSVPLSKVKQQEAGGGVFRETYLKMSLESGATVTARCHATPDHVTRLGNQLQTARTAAQQKDAQAKAAAAAAAAPAPVAAAKAAPQLSKLQAQSARIDQEVTKLEGQISKCQEEAMGFVKQGTPAAKKRAMMVLQKKKMYETQRDQYLGQQMNIEQMQMSVEQAQNTKAVVDAMKAGQEQIAKVTKEAGVDQIEDLMDAIAETQEELKEATDLLSQPLGGGMAMDDEADFNEEWERMQAEAALDVLNAGDPMLMPTLPTATLAAPAGQLSEAQALAELEALAGTAPPLPQMSEEEALKALEAMSASAPAPMPAAA